MLTTVPSLHVNFSSSGRVGLVPGLQDVLIKGTVKIYVATAKLSMFEAYKTLQMTYL